MLTLFRCWPRQIIVLKLWDRLFLVLSVQWCWISATEMITILFIIKWEIGGLLSNSRLRFDYHFTCFLILVIISDWPSLLRQISFFTVVLVFKLRALTSCSSLAHFGIRGLCLYPCDAILHIRYVLSVAIFALDARDLLKLLLLIHWRRRSNTKEHGMKLKK